MMPYGLGMNVDWSFALIAAGHHISHELPDILCRHPQGLDPSHLTAVNSVVALGPVYSHDCVFRLILALPIAQVKQISIVKAVACRPFVIGHGLDQVLLSIQLLE